MTALLCEAEKRRLGRDGLRFASGDKLNEAPMDSNDQISTGSRHQSGRRCAQRSLHKGNQRFNAEALGGTDTCI